MFTISSQLYEELAARLREEIGRDGYFSGSIALPFEGTDCKLKASVVIYRKLVEEPEGTRDIIDDVVPVWWEFSTVCEGEELLNDFSFGDFKEFLL